MRVSYFRELVSSLHVYRVPGNPYIPAVEVTEAEVGECPTKSATLLPLDESHSGLVGSNLGGTHSN
jgi:hypothetical protein